MTQLGTIAVGARQQGVPLAGLWPALIEVLAVLAAIAALLPAFDRVAEVGAGRDGRFADAGLRVDGLPAAVLPGICAAYAGLAQAPLAERLCASADSGAAAPTNAEFPQALTRAAARAASAFAAPMDAAQARLDALRQQQRDADGDVRAMADAMAAVEGQIQPFIEHYRLAGTGSPGPLPLACALAWAQAVWAEPGAAEAAAAARGSRRADAALLLAAALDGRAATASLAGSIVWPVLHSVAPCPVDASQTLSASAALMGDAHQSAANESKNEAMRDLMQSAGWQWAGAMGIGFGLLLWSRRARSPALGIATALALWAGAAWLARVPWPLASHRAFQPARLDPALDTALNGAPAGFVLWLLGCAAVMLLVAVGRRRFHAAPAAPALAAAPSSRIGYAGLVLATGLGWLLLLDLSANGNPANRYLALYHQGHLWLAMLVFSIVLFLRRPLAHGLAWSLVVAGEAGRGVARRLGRGPVVALLVVVALAGIAAFGLLLANLRQLTSELGRVWLIGGAAWFFFLRGGPLAERLARAGPLGASLLRYAWPLLFVVAVLLGAMFVTRDMGPLLIAGYASGAFIAATVAMWAHLRFARKASAGVLAYLLAVLLFAGWIGVVTLTLFRFGEVHSVTATRLESLAAPFASTNDQLALVTWFQRAAPPGGFGIGATPWCGYAAAGQCSGVPAQIHSDYTFTAIVGVFGSAAAWAAVLGCAVWLHRLIRHHGRVTRGEPRLVAGAGRLANDAQALLSWIGVAWVVLSLAQLAVTVAGNLAVLPLTGVTFPIVSFGMTSLVVNLGFLALCLSVDRSDHD